MTSILQNVSGQTNSTVADLSKFNMKVANEHYKVKKEDSLEAILLALHLPGDQVDFIIFFKGDHSYPRRSWTSTQGWLQPTRTCRTTRT